MTPLATRLRASGIHLALSFGVATFAAALVFYLWYPWPLWRISAGAELFLLIVTIDVIVGPLITFVVYNSAKPQRELARDLSVVALLQVSALAYGLHTVAVVRPVAIVLSNNQLRVVSAFEIADQDLAKAAAPYNQLPWTGPMLVGVKPPKTPQEMASWVEDSLFGMEALRPERWRPWDATVAEEARTALGAPAPANAEAIAAAATAAIPLQHLGVLLVIAREPDWLALFDRRDGRLVGYSPRAIMKPAPATSTASSAAQAAAASATSLNSEPRL